MNEMKMQLELLEEVAAPGDARDFVAGVGVGLGIVAGVAGLVAFT